MHLVDEGGHRAPFKVSLAMIGGDGGEGGQIGGVRDDIVGALGGLDHVHGLPEQDDALKRPGLRHQPGDHAGAQGAVAFTQHIDRRIVSPMILQPAGDEVGGQLRIAHDGQQDVVFILAGDATEARGGRIDEDEIGHIQKRIGVRREFGVRRNRRSRVRRRIDPNRTEPAHMQPA